MEVVIARIMSGQLVIAEKTKAGLKFPLIITLDRSGFSFVDFFGGLTKGGKDVAKKIEILESQIIGQPVEPLDKMVTAYEELKIGLTLPKKKIVDALGNIPAVRN